MRKFNSKLMESIFLILVLCIMAALFYRFTEQNAHRIQIQNQAYASDAAKQMALNLHDEFKYSQEVIEVYAFYLKKILKSPNVTSAMLKEMEENSPFDGIRFTTPDGITHTADGSSAPAAEKRFYIEGMQGKSGMTITDSRIYHQSALNFFTPVYFEKRIIGVLHAARKSSTFLRQLLDASYFGQTADVFLCRLNGDILANSNADYTGNIASALLKEHIIDEDSAREMERFLIDRKTDAFLAETEKGSSNISIIKLPGYNYLLVQIFPLTVSQSMINAANQAGVELELSLLALFACVAALLILRARLQKKRLESKNHNLGMIIRGMNILFSGRYLLGNFITGECVYVGASEKEQENQDRPIPYVEIEEKQVEGMPFNKDREEYLSLFQLDNLRAELTEHATVACTCRSIINGSEIWENIIGINLHPEGAELSSFLIVHQNVTEMKQREVKARNKIADMNRKERQYQLALTANAFSAYEFNVSRDLLENDVLQKVGKKEVSLLAGRGLSLPCKASAFLDSWKSYILPESLQDYTAKANVPWLRKRFYEGTQEVEMDFWIQDGLGQEQCIRQSFYMASNELTGDVMALSVMRDITAQVVKQRSQTKALQDALLLAQHANDAKSTFLSNMSHDIRTPMNAIIGFATIASSHLDNANQVRECLRKVLSSSNHLLNLINDILDMSRIESGKMQIREQPCNISELMHNVITIIQPQVKAKQMELSIETFDVVNEGVITDPLKLNQVLINLLGNAVKYTPSGGTITFRMTQKPSFKQGYADYIFEVGDNGIGMTQEFVEHIFEPFTRATTTTLSGIQGTGLGMAITRNIIEMMNGHIEVETELGKGSLFTVTLTLRLQEEESSVHDVKILEGARALVIDDDFHVCNSVCKMLRTLGMRPEWTTSGREGVYRAQLAKQDNDPFMTYIVDWQMPDMNGMLTTSKLRDLAGPDVPIIILTAYEWAEIEDDAAKAKISAFCAKPLFVSDLKNALLSSINKKEEAPKQISRERFKGARVLLVDDVEMNREVAEFILAENGFEVETAPDGTDAVEMVKRSPERYYDIILMDVQMPTMNGYEATRAIRALDREDVKRVPILAMTANALEEDKANALKSGMNAHIAKPIDVKTFFDVLGRYYQTMEVEGNEKNPNCQ